MTQAARPAGSHHDADKDRIVMTTEPCAVELRKLRQLATKTINEHTNDKNLCAICGSAWPCERVALADHNLDLASVS